MGKHMFVSVVCLIVAASSFTSCCAARELPHSLPGDEASSSEVTTSKVPNNVNDVTYLTLTESDEDDINSYWEDFTESEELATCVAGAEIGTEELSLKEPCRRILQDDYGSPTTNKNNKNGDNYQNNNGNNNQKKQKAKKSKNGDD